MTRYRFLRLLRNLICTALPGWSGDWMPRQYGSYGEYTKLYIDLDDGSCFLITVEQVRWK